MVEKISFSGTCIFRVIGFLRPSPHIPPPKKNMLFLEKDVRNIVEKLSKLGSKNAFCKIWYLEISQQWSFFFSKSLSFFIHLLFFTLKANPRKLRLHSLLNKNNSYEVGLTRPGKVP